MPIAKTYREVMTANFKGLRCVQAVHVFTIVDVDREFHIIARSNDNEEHAWRMAYRVMEISVLPPNRSCLRPPMALEK